MKKYLTFIAVILISLSAFAFDWPQAEVTKNSFNSYFGQNRGGILSTSIIFSEPEEVKAAENGYITAIITENNDDSDFFPSTLGTAVIIAHNDELISVYGNLDAETLTLKNENEHTVDAGATIASSGNSGYQENHGNLEFKIIDAKNKSAINPIVLMPRAQEEIPLSLSGIIIVSKNNDYYDINTYKTYTSGLYKVYFKRNPVASPYKTSVSINGVIVDQLSYDMITQENNKLCIIGKKKYTDADIFPNDDLQLLGEAMFTPGRVTLGLSISDMLGNVKQLNYNIVIR
ncbi:M23 family metallopeptidase [Treponema bryantii]|uniref:M23 family metallopeptidase n=1 Tax=Treponema bryantii TaxID=163 RepID=UPI0003B3A527|nr:M23 family metallopeptidase [Treponema bryantii]